MIKKAFTSVLSLSMFMLPSLSFSAEKLASSQDVSQYIHVGDVSASGFETAEDAETQLEKLAQDKGADFYKVILLTQPGNSSRWSGYAVLYKK